MTDPVGVDPTLDDKRTAAQPDHSGRFARWCIFSFFFTVLHPALALDPAG